MGSRSRAWRAPRTERRGSTVTASLVIAAVRRGCALDALTLFAIDGRALHIQAYGFTEDEARRNREELLRWFAASGIAIVEDEEGRPV